MIALNAKPLSAANFREVIYRRERWALLKEVREKAMSIVVALESFHLQTRLYGSVARGDVNKDSDVDVFIPDPSSSFLVETALEKSRIIVEARLIVQATPSYAMKAHLEIDSKTSVSFPLMAMRRVEREFYQFGGELTLSQLKSNMRVAGVDKRLMLIEPTEKGHIEGSIINREEQAAKLLGISAETVLDRVHTLMKRDRVGRTGVFVKRELSSDDTFEMAMAKLAKENPAVRRRLNAK
jgi:predicted nucleotidyltransferase